MERFRIIADVGLYYVTFTVTEWLPVFIEETACKIITESLNFCIRQKHLGVNAYVIMPTHLHAILFVVTALPYVPNLQSSINIRVVIYGYVENNTNEPLGAYLDVILNP